MRDASRPTAPGRVPEAYIHAEIATFPLTSEIAFVRSITELDPALNKDSDTELLWRACEAELAEHTSWSLDRLVTVRDATWFDVKAIRAGHRAEPVSMASYLRHVARSDLEASPGVTRLIDDAQHPRWELETRHRWLCFSVPEDLVHAGLGVQPTPLRTETDTPLLLRRLLDAGVAELHQHVGAGMDFSLLWASALAALAAFPVAEHWLQSPGVPLDGGRDLVRWLLAAAIARCLLGEFLVDRLRRESTADFPMFLRRTRFWSPRQHDIVAKTLSALELGDVNKLPDFLDLRDVYSELHPAAEEIADDPLASVADAYKRCDPLSARFALEGVGAGERFLQTASLEYLLPREQETMGSDRLFATFFWQVMRIRCFFYRAIVERPLTAGLQWFARFYDRIAPFRAPLEQILVEASYATAGAHGYEGIAALELRTSMARSSYENAEYLMGVAHSWQKLAAQRSETSRPLEIGVVFHFLKSRDKEGDAWHRGAPAAFWAGTHAEPLTRDDARLTFKDLSQGRYLQLFRDQAARSTALAQLLHAAPSVLWLLRGLDVAADELGVPTWVFVPLFEYLRAVSEKGSGEPHAPPPLRVTAHVGEDFRHLLEGMRRVYEQVHYVLGPRGGRLGHAVALGIDPAAWADAAGSVTMPAEERLWDLVFEWRLYAKHKIAPEFAVAAPAGRLERLQVEVADLADLVFGRAATLENLAETHDLLHRFLLPMPGEDPTTIELGIDRYERAITRRERSSGKRYRVLRKLLLDEQTFIRGQTPVDVPLEPSTIESLSQIQNGLRRGVARRGIVVEVNPSSNLLIGDLSDLRNHPIIRLCPPEREHADLPVVPIVVGSDNPVIFSTSLLHEYVLLHQAARAAGYSERAVQAWLDSIRQTGMEARMTLSLSPPRIQELIIALADFAHCTPQQLRSATSRS